MDLSSIPIKIHKCKQYISMMEGLNDMIKKAPESSKKEMLKDVIKYGKELATDYKNSSGSNEYWQTVNLGCQGLLDIEERKNKELNVKINKLENQIKQMIK